MKHIKPLGQMRSWHRSQIWSFIIVLCILICLIPNISAQEISNFTNESGETWISWTWEANDTVSIYCDGKYVNISDLGNYSISDLNPNEKHQLILNLNNSSTFYENTVYTKKASFENNLIALLIFSITFILLGFFMFPFFSLLGTILAFYGGISAMSQTTESWIIITFWLLGTMALFSFAFEFGGYNT